MTIAQPAAIDEQRLIPFYPTRGRCRVDFVGVDRQKRGPTLVAPGLSIHFLQQQESQLVQSAQQHPQPDAAAFVGFALAIGTANRASEVTINIDKMVFMVFLQKNSDFKLRSAMQHTLHGSDTTNSFWRFNKAA